MRRDPAAQVSEVTFRYQRRRPGAPPESHAVRTSMRHLFRYEVEHLLARCGFTDIRIFGGFDRRPYDYFSGETVILARVYEGRSFASLRMTGWSSRRRSHSCHSEERSDEDLPGLLRIGADLSYAQDDNGRSRTSAIPQSARITETIRSR